MLPEVFELEDDQTNNVICEKQTVKAQVDDGNLFQLLFLRNVFGIEIVVDEIGQVSKTKHNACGYMLEKVGQPWILLEVVLEGLEI